MCWSTTPEFWKKAYLPWVTPQSLEKNFSCQCVQGVILNMQYASRLMARNRSGTIINLSSILGRVGNAGTIVYASSKAAVIGITLFWRRRNWPRLAFASTRLPRV